jgi:hypothetical protein
LKFAVHRPGYPVASPRSHGVPRRDVLGCVHVSVVGETAGGAPEDGLALARLLIHLPTRRAALARKCWVDLLYSSRRFLLQAAYQHAPRGSHYAPVQPSLGADVATWIPGRPPGRTRHVPDLEVFDLDQVKPARDVRAGLLCPVFSPVGLAGMQPGALVLNPRAAVRAALSARELALKAPHPCSLPCGKAGGIQHLPGRQSGGYCHTPVDADDLAVVRCWDRLGNGGKGDMPASRAVQRNPIGLYARRQGARPAEPYPPRRRNPDFAYSPAEPMHAPLPPASHNTESLATPSLPPGRVPSGVLRVEEGRLCVGEVPQRLLLYHLAACSEPVILRSGGCELSALLKVARRTRAASMPVQVLLDGQVPNVPGMAAMIPEHRILGGRGKQPVSGHANTLSTTTDIFGEVKRRLVPSLKAKTLASRSR